LSFNDDPISISCNARVWRSASNFNQECWKRKEASLHIRILAIHSSRLKWHSFLYWYYLSNTFICTLFLAIPRTPGGTCYPQNASIQSLPLQSCTCPCLDNSISYSKSSHSYAPVRATCPTTPLVRPANGISSSEQSYINSRYTKAPAALTAFLKSTNTTFSSSKLPVVALTTSGGEYRFLLTGDGVLQGLDSRDSKTGVSGLFQGLTYETGLSGSAWYMFNQSTASPGEYST
jgi:hypothetical protein